jgi:hypothetical protein
MTCGNEEPVTHTMFGRAYEGGPYTACNRYDSPGHGIGCTCAVPDFYRQVTVAPKAVIDGSCFWPMDDADGDS